MPAGDVFHPDAKTHAHAGFAHEPEPHQCQHRLFERKPVYIESHRNLFSISKKSFLRNINICKTIKGRLPETPF